MNFETTEKIDFYLPKVKAFVEDHVIPVEKEIHEQLHILKRISHPKMRQFLSILKEKKGDRRRAFAEVLGQFWGWWKQM